MAMFLTLHVVSYVPSFAYCARPHTTKRDERRAEPNPTELQEKLEASPPPPVLREAVLLAEDAHSPKPQLVPGPHDPHRNLASVRGHKALEWHIEGSSVSCCARLLLGDRRGVQCSAPPSGMGQRRRRPAKHHAADGRQQHSRSDLHDVCKGRKAAGRSVYTAFGEQESRVTDSACTGNKSELNLWNKSMDGTWYTLLVRNVSPCPQAT